MITYLSGFEFTFVLCYLLNQQLNNILQIITQTHTRTHIHVSAYPVRTQSTYKQKSLRISPYCGFS